MKEGEPRYIEDEQGYYNQHVAETQHVKARPLDFEDGELVYDSQERARLREIRRQLVAEMNAPKKRP